LDVRFARVTLVALGVLSASAGAAACNSLTGASDLSLAGAAAQPGTTTGIGTTIGGGGGAQGTGGQGGSAPPVVSPLAADVTIAEVDVQQGVPVPLMKDGQPAEGKAPVVQKRTALIRVFPAPRDGYQARDLIAELDLADGSGDKPPRQVTKHVTGPGAAANLDSTFNFTIPADEVTGDLRWSVSIHEAVGGAPTGDTTGAEYPAGGAKLPLGAKDAHGNFRVVLVPFKYGADGSNRLPDTSPAQVETYHKRLLGTYPAPDTEITVHAPAPFGIEFSPDGAGWGELLQATCELRAKEKPDHNVYYYGIIEPASSFDGFCGGGCVAGLANLTEDPNDDYGRCSIGLGYPGQETADVALQEIAHSLGRRHADCGNPDLVDPSFPYQNGSIGNWGWDATTNTMQKPTLSDFMSYCQPVWISDYTYAALFERIAYVNAAKRVIAAPGATTEWRSGLVGRDGAVKLGGALHLDGHVGGAARDVDVIDVAGHVQRTVTGRYYGFDRVLGGTLLVPADAVPAGGSVRLR
jgi:hypothetical protein